MATYLSSIARPYAQAAFEFAKEAAVLPEWKAFLDNAAAAVSDPAFASLMTAERLSKEEVHDVLFSILKPSLDEKRTNFLHLVIQNKRIMQLPDMAALFDVFLSTFMKKLNVRLITAVDASEQFKEKLQTHLSHKLKQEIVLDCEKDPSILGGAIISMDNQVIDGSLRNKLNRLLEFTLR